MCIESMTLHLTSRSSTFDICVVFTERYWCQECRHGKNTEAVNRFSLVICITVTKLGNLGNSVFHFPYLHNTAKNI